MPSPEAFGANLAIPIKQLASESVLQFGVAVAGRFASGALAILPRSHMRDWLYARDAAVAVVELLDARDRRHRVYNLAAGFMWSVADFCARLQHLWPAFEWRFVQRGEQANIDYYALYDRAPMANDRLRSDTTFVPRYDLAEALADYLGWLGSTLGQAGTAS